MAENTDRRVSTYATNLPGRVPYDEARRAAADLCRLARMWVSIAEQNEEALNPTHEVIYEDEDGEEVEVPRPGKLLSSNTREEDLKKAVREHWTIWVAGLERARVAISAVPDLELGPERVTAKRAMMELVRIFFPPLFLLPHEEPGDQLLRPAGPMACRPRGKSNLRRERIEKIVEPLADFSDLMIIYDTDPGSMGEESLDTDSGWTVTLLADHVGRSESLLVRWRDVAEPKVPGRSVKGETFMFGEIGRLSVAAMKCGHHAEADKLGRIAAARKPPGSP